MSLLRLDALNVRNLSTVKLTPILSGFNLIYGNNGSGKTSLLEAIYYLSRGRSFRTSTFSRIINHQADRFSIFSQIQTQASSIPVGIERQRSGETKIKAGGVESSIADLAQLIPALLINSQSLSLIDAGPAIRRKYLDWLLFYLNADFITIWRQYEKALKQRNAALHVVSHAQLDIWTHELARSAQKLDEMRQNLVKPLVFHLTAALGELLHLPALDIYYFPGWNSEQPYLETLQQTLNKDKYFGFTQTGPHRADLRMMLNGLPVKDILSRGQQKLFICAMILAQGLLLQQHVDRKPIYLVDDLPAELDSLSKSKFISLLAKQNTQVFLTTVEKDILDQSLFLDQIKMFHVEQGQVAEV